MLYKRKRPKRKRPKRKPIKVRTKAGIPAPSWVKPKPKSNQLKGIKKWLKTQPLPTPRKRKRKPPVAPKKKRFK